MNGLEILKNAANSTNLKLSRNLRHHRLLSNNE